VRPPTIGSAFDDLGRPWPPTWTMFSRGFEQWAIFSTMGASPPTQIDSVPRGRRPPHRGVEHADPRSASAARSPGGEGTRCSMSRRCGRVWRRAPGRVAGHDCRSRGVGDDGEVMSDSAATSDGVPCRARGDQASVRCAKRRPKRTAWSRGRGFASDVHIDAPAAKPIFMMRTFHVDKPEGQSNHPTSVDRHDETARRCRRPKRSASRR